MTALVEREEEVDEDGQDVGIIFLRELKDRTPLFLGGKIPPAIPNRDYETVCFIEQVYRVYLSKEVK